MAVSTRVYYIIESTDTYLWCVSTEDTSTSPFQSTNANPAQQGAFAHTSSTDQNKFGQCKEL